MRRVSRSQGRSSEGTGSSVAGCETQRGHIAEREQARGRREPRWRALWQRSAIRQPRTSPSPADQATEQHCGRGRARWKNKCGRDGHTLSSTGPHCRRAGRPTAKIPPADPPSAGIISSPDYRTRDPVGARGARALAARILDAVRRGVLRALLVVVPAEPAARSPSVLGGRRARISGRRAGRAVPAPALASAACRPRRIPGRTHGSPQPSARVTVSRHASLSAEPALFVETADMACHGPRDGPLRSR